MSNDRKVQAFAIVGMATFDRSHSPNVARHVGFGWKWTLSRYVEQAREKRRHREEGLLLSIQSQWHWSSSRQCLANWKERLMEKKIESVRCFDTSPQKVKDGIKNGQSAKGGEGPTI